MTQFWMICAALLLVALAFVVLPLWRSRVRNNDVARDAANLAIFRDQIAEMDADLANGLLTEELYEQGKRELQARLLDEVKSSQADGLTQGDPHRKLAIGLVVVIPLLALGLYGVVGNQNAFLPQVTHAAADGFGAIRSEAALEELQKKLAQEPANAEGWLLLARSLVELEKYPEAVGAFKKLVELVPNESPVWADYADAQAMANGQSLVGEPTKMLDKALAIDPANPKALALSGSAAMERGDYPAAIRHWENLLKQMPKDSEDAKMVEGGVQQAREFLKLSKSGKAPMMAAPQQPEKIVSDGKERITGTITLGDVVKANASPEDTLFVVARAVPGPKMPLAIIRKQVKDLPLKFTLDDSMAMSSEMKLSNFDQVVVIARVSKSGTAMLQAGDLEGMSQPLKPGSKDVNVTINNIVQQGAK
ncbi:c-type cytochrome biogenesis protein CcmI [Ferriphaselus sp. R-1]|uniref:c-type cytochrome biogenesis protein CcmI n=1 Tax=Ferriphaselus sp. R-1 TaxID=1485544 RepID=UPI000558FB08|nr:c-type cytochrome biogenesis protein CcmI [Ferriphaselus sp. R-1]